MIKIDGKGGGGQILRTSLGLSAITQKPFEIKNIRINRKNPGLKEQHLQGVLAMKKLTDADVTGAKKQSTTLTFEPKKIKSGNLRVQIATAGAIGLILQVLLIPAIKTNIKIQIKGGATYNKWAPPISHFENVLLPLLNYKAKINIKKHGFYPKGGAEVEVLSPETKLKQINLLEKGEIKEIKGISLASSKIKNKRVAERQANEAKRILMQEFDIQPKIKTMYVDSLNPGSGIQLALKTTKTIYGGDSLGELGVTSEKVAQQACKTLIDGYKNGTVDKFTADQLLPYIALTQGSFIAPEITNHIKTNISTIEKFVPIKFKIDNNKIYTKII